MTTLVLHPRYDEDSQLLWQEAINRGWEVSRVTYSGTIKERIGTRLEVNSKQLAIYGGYMWGEQVAKITGRELLSPIPEWPTLLNPKHAGRMIWLGNLGDAKKPSFTYPVFIKSLHGKQFDARVYHSIDDSPQLGADIQVLFSTPLHMQYEYRAFILDGKILTACQYATDGKLDIGELEPPYPIFQAIVDRVQDFIPKSVVIDFAATNAGCVVVEANPTWCSAIYACNPAAVLEAVREATLNK